MEYFLIKPNGEQTGTFSHEQVKAMLAAGYIDQNCRFWHEGVDGWQPIARLDELAVAEPPPTTTPSLTSSQRISAAKIAAVLKAVPPASTKLEKIKTSTGKLPRLLNEPERPDLLHPSVPTADRDYPPGEERASHDYPAAESAAPQEPKVIIQHVPIKPRIPRWADRLVCIIIGILLVVAVNHFDKLQQHLANAFSNRVTLSKDDTFALFQPNAIKSFTQDMQSSPTLQMLRTQLDQVTDPVEQGRFKIEIQKETEHHAQEIREQYLHSNSAETIEPGSYRVEGYFNDQGDPTDKPADGQPVWVSITYKNHVVYALKNGNAAATPAP